MADSTTASSSPRLLKMLINGAWRDGRSTYDVIDPYRKTLVARAPESTMQDLDDALTAAVGAKGSAMTTPAYKRAEILRAAAERLVPRTDAIAEIIARETGKAIRDARAEVQRSHDTIMLSAEEAIRIQGEHVPLDGSPMGAGKLALLLRFPVGVVAGITPFNAPFNLACHKLAPAIAAGNTIVLKAPPQSPWAVREAIQLFHDAGVPPGFVNLIYGHNVGPALVRDPRVDFITFTGSSRVGAEIKAASGHRRVALELGGIGPTIVCEDAAVEEAAQLCANHSMRLAGQSCISVQNVFVHGSLYQTFVNRLTEHVRGLKLGDPLDPRTDIGTLIDEGAAKRVGAWVRSAVAQGAKVLTGGGSNGAQFEPTVLIDVTPDMKVVCEEVFGPVVTVQPFLDLEVVFDRINSTPYGLQCGVFTKSLVTAMEVVRSLRMGGIIVNGTSTWRTDQIAYGGLKQSGIGREGPRYAIREMTEQRLVVFNV